jgi:hypothetical protein
VVDDRAEGESKSEAETSSAGNTPKSGEQKSKRGLDQPIKRMSTAALIGSGVVILLVGLVVGLGAGYKIEQSRTKSDVKKLKAAATTPTPDATPATSATTVRLSGKVGSTKGGVVTLTSASGTRTMATKSSTIVVKALPGNLSDITAGQRVLWQATPGQSTHAEEIVVLPSDAKLGSSVVSVSPTSMQLKA